MNYLKTTILLAALTGLVLFIGYQVGGQSGMLIALIISAAMNFASYFWSDKIVLATYGAKPADENTHRDLHTMVSDLAISANMKKPRIYIINSPLPNAFATGRNEEHAVVAVTSSLMEILNKEELRGVLAHELSHVKNKDMLIGSVAATIAGAISYLAQMAHYAMIFRGGSREEGNKEILTSLLMLILAPIIATLLHLAISRSREYLADESGAKIAGNPTGLADALEKLENFSKNHKVQGTPREQATAHLFIINPFKPTLLLSLFSTHPPAQERVARLRKM